MSHREKDDDYDTIIAQLGESWRVIECKDHIQWIVQERTGGQWRSRHYCTSAEGVRRRAKGLPGYDALADLPARFCARQGVAQNG